MLVEWMKQSNAIMWVDILVFLPLQFACFVISDFYFLLALAMPFTTTKPPASTYQSWEYIYGMVYEIESLIF
jgi:hypothetical protein